MIAVLLEADTTQTNLGRKTKLAAQTLERTLETLSQGGLVERLPGSQGAWRIAHWPETFAVLLAARRLGVALSGSDDRAAELEAEQLDRLERARGPQPAARRGGRRDADEEP